MEIISKIIDEIGLNLPKLKELRERHNELVDSMKKEDNEAKE